ncbi:hypothetical protein IQ03_03992 [Gemmobacter caeni]|uniref:Uncharacterized protein n=1 Tax=Gemmobacter caeni TaxID=589035 RepID=A0A2T6B987_9RHOB|nr:hypothetical protein [Gemmobacter caeni]PTX52588.1 hypothetical protein C8N34_102368 [Gemmobacter caeni]TWI94955.1 hypothetical protein IQ03_03992 [Gemmobacter caeni]
MSMRRPVSPRGVLKRMFRDLERGYEGFWGKHATCEGRDRYQLMAQRLREVADHAVSTAQEAPPFRTEKLAELIGQGDPDRVTSFIRKHLVSELTVLEIPGLPPEPTADRLLAALSGPQALDRIAADLIAETPGLEAPEFTAYQLESVLREAVGLDGRVPERGFSEDAAEANLMQIRLLLGAPGPDYGSTPAPALAGEADREAVERALEASGLPQVGGISRDLAFHAAVGNVADDLTRRIGLLMGGEVSATHAQLLHGIVERVAHATGPQITIEIEGPGGP